MMRLAAVGPASLGVLAVPCISSGSPVDVKADARAVLDSQVEAWNRGDLRMGDGKEPHGLFTLLLRRLDGGWVIVHDHTSAGE